MALSRDQEALMDAVLDNSTRRVNTLLKKGVDPDFADDDQQTPLHTAIRNANFSMVKALVEAGADVNRAAGYYKDLPLDAADSQGEDKITEYLEGKGARSSDPERLTVKQNALMTAVMDGDVKKAQALMAKGVDPDFMDVGESTPLDEAIRRDDETMVRALVAGGADVNRVSSFGDAPLDMARDMGFTSVATYLESEGAVTGRSRKKQPSFGGGHIRTKKTRGRSVGVQEDWGDDYWDDDRHYFGADEDDARRKSGAKPHIKPKSTAARQPVAGGAENAPPKPPRPVFREDTLKDIFNAKNWTGKTKEMEELWQDVPRRLHKHFDFAAALAEAKRDTLKLNAARQNITLQLKLKPQFNAPQTPAQPAAPVEGAAALNDDAAPPAPKSPPLKPPAPKP